MRFSYSIRLLAVILGAGLTLAAQNDSQNDQDQGTAPTPAPAFGQNAPILSPENPPISGIDEPRLDLRRALRSYVSAGFGVSETGDTNPNNTLGNATVLRSVTRVAGAADLQRFWSKSDLFAEYLGGGGFYERGISDTRQLHAVGLMGVTRWRTGQAAIRDSFSYLPEGSFEAGGFGGGVGLDLAKSGGLGIPGGGIPGLRLFGGNQFSSFGLIPRVSNRMVGDIVQSLSPRSAVTLAGGYSFSHFLEDQDILFNSQQLTIEGGYSYMLNRRDQVAAVVAFQEFRFPQSSDGKIDAYAMNARWARTLTGRMRIMVSAGPQYTSIYQQAIPFLVGSSQDRHLGLSARASLTYALPRSRLSANYEKFTTEGSGIFAGASTQLARATWARSLTRSWEMLLDTGYAHEERLGFASKGFGGKTSNTGFVGAALRRHLGRSWGAFAEYRFNETGLDAPFCNNVSGCGRISTRNRLTIGVDWHTRPYRIE